MNARSQNKWDMRADKIWSCWNYTVGQHNPERAKIEVAMSSAAELCWKLDLTSLGHNAAVQRNNLQRRINRVP